MTEFVPSRFGLVRYRVRLFAFRLIWGRPSAGEIVNLGLGVVGAWGAFVALTVYVSGGAGPGRLLLAVAVLIVVTATLLWLLLARRPQRVFAFAAESDSRAERLRELMAQGMHSEAAFDSLAELYRPAVAQVAATFERRAVVVPTDRLGRTSLVVTIEANEADRLGGILAATDQVRGDDWATRSATFADERQSYIRRLRRSAAHGNRFDDESGDNVVLDEMADPDRLRLRVATASYGQIVRTSDSLLNEFAVFGALCERSAFRRRPRPLRLSSRQALKVLPWRRSVHAWDAGADLLVRPRGRAAGIGVSVAVIGRGDPDPVAYVARRSTKVGTYPLSWHVVPSGMINFRWSWGSNSATAGLESLAELTMLAEFVEECFDVEEMSGHSPGDFASRVLESCATQGVEDVRPVLTGLSIDLLNLRSEVCALIDLTSQPEIVNRFQLCWEYSRAHRIDELDVRSGAATVERADFVQSGLGCVHLASRHLARLAE